MTLSNSDLYERFENGHDSGKASSQEIRRLSPDFVALVGYEWAVYALYDSVKGEITVFEDWSGYSSTTTKHISRLSTMADRVESGKPCFKYGNLKPRGSDTVEQHLV